MRLYGPAAELIKSAAVGTVSEKTVDPAAGDDCENHYSYYGAPEKEFVEVKRIHDVPELEWGGERILFLILKHIPSRMVRRPCHFFIRTASTK